MDADRDLPEGVVDADPPGGWESGATADGETAEQSTDAEGSPRLTDAAADAASHAARPSGDADDPAGGVAPEQAPDDGTVSLDPDLSVDRERENREEQ
jgi:hypothetical protein